VSCQIGQTVGVAVAGVTLAAGSATRASLATGTHLGWTLNTGYGIAVLILGLLSTTAWAKATAHDAAATPPGDDTGTPSPRDPSPAAGTRAPVPS